MKSSLFIASLVAFGNSAHAVHLNLVGKRQTPSSSLRKRAAIFGSETLSDSLDIQYSCNISLGGVEFATLIDTGSSDLWVASGIPIPGATNTGAVSGVQYAVGEVQGPIELAKLEFADYEVPKQAFLLISPDSSNPDGNGLIGLGPSAGSNILQTLDSSVGNTPLDSIFLQNTSTPNYLTILLGRADDQNPFPGDLTVGEIVPGYESILSQPHLPVTTVSLANAGGQHWQVLLDKDGALGTDGKPIPFTSEVGDSTSRNQATVVFDSGFSLPQVPKSFADAYYSSFPGAEYGNVAGIGDTWILPCASEVNISYKFGGITFPVHPLDATLEPQTLGLEGVQNSQGEDCCIGAFQPVSFDAQGLFDVILGMAFLRNSYLLVNFGDFIEGKTDTTADPYIQLLSTTNNSADAHNDFITFRLNGSGSAVQGSSVSHSGNSHSVSHSRLYYIIAAAVIGVGVLSFLTVCACFIKKRNTTRRTAAKAWGSYAPLSAPAPAPAVEMQMQPPNKGAWNQPYGPMYNQPYQPPTHQAYGEPWAPRY
jgi:hypothetical protein